MPIDDPKTLIIGKGAPTSGFEIKDYKWLIQFYVSRDGGKSDAIIFVPQP